MNNKYGIVNKIYSKKTMNRVSKKVKLLGVNYKYSHLLLLNNRFYLSILLFIVILVTRFGYFMAPIGTLIFIYLSEYLELDWKIKQRIRILNDEALFFFEVLALSLESGKDIRGALEITINNLDGHLASEFRKTLEEMAMGKSLKEALGDMKERIPSDAINNVILSIKQTSIYGSDIIGALYDQIDYLREKRLQEIKTSINKLPLKISVISVIFFLPIIILIILAPAILNLLG